MANKLSEEILALGSVSPLLIYDVFELIDLHINPNKYVRVYSCPNLAMECFTSSMLYEEMSAIKQTVICLLANMTLKEIREIFYEKRAF